jgi:hypothetical protein
MVPKGPEHRPDRAADGLSAPHPDRTVALRAPWEAIDVEVSPRRSHERLRSLPQGSSSSSSASAVPVRPPTYGTSRASADAMPMSSGDHDPVGSHRSRDLAFAAGVGVLVLVWTWGVGRVMPADRQLDAGGYLLVTTCAVALVWRRDAPLPVLAATTIGTTGYLSVGYPYGPMLVLMAIAVYTVARHLPWRTAVPAALVALGVLLLHLLFNSAALPGALGLIPASAWVAVPFAIGSTVASIDAGRRAAVERGIADERLRVEHEVHDVVGHGGTLRADLSEPRTRRSDRSPVAGTAPGHSRLNRSVPTESEALGYVPSRPSDTRTEPPRSMTAGALSSRGAQPMPSRIGWSSQAVRGSSSFS